MKRNIVYLMLTLLVPGVTLAAPATTTSDYEYPELMVTPKASQRLYMEAVKESRNPFSLIPYQLSAAATLAGGIMVSSYPKPSTSASTTATATTTVTAKAPLAGYIVGGGWLAATTLLGVMYQPYESAWAVINKMPAQTKRDQLTRERLAEEAIESASALGTRLMWLSAISNFGACTYMLAKSEKDSIAVVANAAGMVMAIAPMIFKTRWQRVSSEQEDYKKKIYGPLAMNALLLNPSTGRIDPGIQLSYNF